jgi:hypothetical protein
MVAYPVMRDDAGLAIDLKGHGSVEVALP